VLLAQGGNNDLSPSKEAFHGGLTTPTMADSAANAQRLPYGLSVDADVPMTARLRTGSHDVVVSPSMSLDDVRRRTVKFINGEDGTSRVINIEDCYGGVEVLEKALRKFGKWRPGHGADAALDSESDGDHDGSAGLELDGWSVYLEGDGGFHSGSFSSAIES
jgi:mitogen-activated protein kinase kinase kinase